MKFGWYQGKVYKESVYGGNRLFLISNPLKWIEVRKLDTDYDGYAAGSWLGKPCEYNANNNWPERILGVYEDPLDLIYMSTARRYIINIPTFSGSLTRDIINEDEDVFSIHMENGTLKPIKELEEYRLYYKDGDNYYLVHEKRRK